MGTSKGYSAPQTPQWSHVKSIVTRTAGAGKPERAVAREVVGAFVTALGGPKAASRGSGSIGRGRAAQRVAAGFASFATAVALDGLDAALARNGLAALVGRPAAEVLDALIEHLGGPADTLDDVDARNALARLREEMLNDLETREELEEMLSGMVTKDQLEHFLVAFFGYYLFEQFIRVFYERLVRRVGDARATAYLDGIEAYLRAVIEEQHQSRDLGAVDWAGDEGQRLTDSILEEALRVFGGGE
jgi:hypothetical protein